MTVEMRNDQDVDIDLRQLVAGMAANWRRIVAVALAVTLLALAYVWLATPRYRAETRILIETRESVFTRPQSVTDTERPTFDEESVISQVEVIASTDLIKQVADRLGLASREEFGADGGSLPARILTVLGLRGEAGPLTREERMIRAFRERLSVYRVDKSRVIVIEFSSQDPKLAAEVPNALADAYIAVQREAKVLSDSDATAWLEPEIADLRTRVREAEAKVAEFRSRSDLLVGQNNAVLATQQLAEISTELSRVRANRAAAEANAEGVRAALAAGASLDALPEVLSSGLIQRLREREVQLKADIADLSTSLLDNHPRIRALRSQLADLEEQIRAEARKLLAGLETEARTAQLREQQLTAELNRLKAESSRAGEETVELRALEREATAQRELLESYLTRYREAAARGEGAYAPVDARIFSRAIVPAEPYFPKPLPILGAAFVGTLLVMAIAVLLGELFSGRAMRPAARAPRPARASTFFVPPPSPAASAEAGRIGIEEAAAALVGGAARRMLIVSPEGDEAAASAILLARTVADAGLRTILVDLTATGAASRPMLDDEALPGITDLLAARASLGGVVQVDRYSDCDVIPSGTADPATAMRGARRLPIILQSLATAYEAVVVECGATDAAAVAALADEDTAVLVSVVEAPQALVEATLADLAENGFADVGIVTPDPALSPAPKAPGRTAAAKA